MISGFFGFLLFGCLLLPIVLSFLFKLTSREKKIEPISWSVPIPPDLLARLREFSPLSISRTSGMYLDDVFDILKGERPRTAPEVINKLEDTIKKLQKHDEELDKQAAKLAYMMRGLDVIEEKTQKKISDLKSLPEPKRD